MSTSRASAALRNEHAARRLRFPRAPRAVLGDESRRHDVRINAVVVQAAAVPGPIGDPQAGERAARPGRVRHPLEQQLDTLALVRHSRSKSANAGSSTARATVRIAGASTTGAQRTQSL